MIPPGTIGVRQLQAALQQFDTCREILKRELAHYWPITKLMLTGDQVRREDLWPTNVDLEKPVILPGGEVAILKTWRNASDFKERRWQVEFYNNTR